MSANGKLLHHRHHFHHGRRLLPLPDNLGVKPTIVVPAFSSPKNLDCSHFAGLRLTSSQSHPGYGEISRLLIMGKRGLGSLPPEWPSDHASRPPKEESTLMTILKRANSFLPQVVLASTVLALIYPPSFTWFTNRYYAPALGFLMFAVGVNSSEKDFLEAFSRPAAILAGYIGQFVIKPLLGYFFGTISLTIFGLPNSLAAGIMLTSCVSGAQLSNYATFLTDPEMAPLSIVMTSISTATAVFVTPFLSLMLIGKRLPVDVRGMVFNILQIVVTPIATGLLLNSSLCVGAPLAINVESLMSPYGASVLLLVIAFHLSAFVTGFSLTGLVFCDLPDVKALQRTLSYETGMQSSLLALALANKFFKDPLVSIPPAISTVIMSLMGFSLVMLWARRKEALLSNEMNLPVSDP
ncbi:putative sodium/metabolite cotransporter bass6, chloroplastic [Orobanche gracilis]